MSYTRPLSSNPEQEFVNIEGIEIAVESKPVYE